MSEGRQACGYAEIPGSGVIVFCWQKIVWAGHPRDGSENLRSHLEPGGIGRSVTQS